MSEHRCAVCGSPNVVTDTQAGGISFNYKKGIVGTVVLGAGGAVAGIESKTQQIFKCQDCGITLTYEMPESLRNAIDLGLISEDVRNFLYADGYGQLSWSLLRMKYKNIEEGLADRIIADRENRRREGLLAYATATKEEFDNAVALITDFERRFSSRSYRDKLPDDAFSDTKPMTLIEYYVWQDAIALFVENVAKHCPNPMSRGLSEYTIKSYFCTYLYEKVRIEHGRFPEFTGDQHCEDFKKIAEENPFVLYFADKYFPQSFTPSGTFDKKIIPWEPDNFADIMRERDLWAYNPSLINISFNFKGITGDEISILRIVPRYTVKDGRLAFWRESNPHNRLPNAAGTLEDYFNVYPDKRSESDTKIATHRQQLSQKGEIESKKQECERTIAQNHEVSNAKMLQIFRLEDKIFGKKAAMAKADVLRQEVADLTEIDTKLKANIAEYTTQLEQIVDDRTFYERLVNEMDNFIVWRWVDDEDRIPFWINEREERLKYTPLHGNLSDTEIQSILLETMEQIGTAVTISDIMYAAPELEENCTRIKLSSILRQLEESGKIRRFDRNRKAYFSVK